MSKLVSIQWSHAKLRVVGANPHGNGIKVNRAFEFEIPADQKEKELAHTIANALKKNGIGRCEAVVVVDRECVEMRQFDVPAVPKEELPDLVRFQAANQFTSFNDSWALDYVPVKFNHSQEATSVLACALSPQLMEQIRECLDVAGIKIKSMTVRGFSAVALTAGSAFDGNQLVIQQVGDEVDVVSLQGSDLVMMRTFKLPNPDHEPIDKKIKQEFQRTLAVCSNQHHQGEFKRACIIGNESDSSDLADNLPIEESKIEYFDAGAIGSMSSALLQTIQQPGAFGPAIGSLIGRAKKQKPVIDLINPRKRPKVVKKDNRLKVYGGIAAVVTLSCLVGAYWFLSSMESKIKKLTKQKDTMVQANASYDQIVGEVEVINKWKRADVDWLDVLVNVSDHLPLPDDAIIDNFEGDLKTTSERMLLNLSGRISSSDLDTKIEKELRKKFLVSPVRMEPAPKDKLFSRKMQKELSLKLDEVEIVEDEIEEADASDEKDDDSKNKAE